MQPLSTCNHDTTSSSSVALPATDLLPGSKSFASQKNLIQLSSFLHTLTYPCLLFYILFLGWFPTTYHGRLLVLPIHEELFSVVVISPSYPVLPHLPCFVLTKCFVLEQPGFIPVCPSYAPANTHGVYSYNPLQHPLHILSLLLHVQFIFT